MVSPHPGSLREPALPVRGLLVTGAVPLACGLARALTPGQTRPGGGRRRARSTLALLAGSPTVGLMPWEENSALNPACPGHDIWPH